MPRGIQVSDEHESSFGTFVPQRPGTFGRSFLPGPSEVRPEVLDAQARAVIGHRGEEMEELMRELELGLQEVFRTERPVFISTSSATGFMEAAVRSGARRRVLCLVNGAFGRRFHEIAVACGLEADAVEVPWGEAHDPGEVEARLEAGRYDAVTVVHSETSTGVLNPVAELSWVVHGFDDVLLLADSVSGAGGAELRTDRWALDFVLAGSQKALALPPGLAFGVASERMMARAVDADRRGYYFDLVEFQRYVDRFQTPNTPAVSLLYALQAQLRRIHAEGMEERWERHRRIARRTWEWVDRMRTEEGVDVEVLAPEGRRSPTVTCILLPDGLTGPEVARAMRRRGYVIGTGYGKLKERSIRIGHMGEHTEGEVDGLLEALAGVVRP